ncbi:MAG TPA: adenylate/guanylate cyclase domain-containing protein [Polyangiaceae bacterium]|jgi:adenylate cyclase
MALLNTVRAKLIALVGLSAVTTAASLPVLHWVMDRELTDVVADRVPEAVRGFDLELADDIRDLEAATFSLAGSEEVARALATNNSELAHGELKVFRKAYPGIVFAAYDKDGNAVAQSGLHGGAPSGERAVGLTELSSGKDEARLITHDGCSAQSAKESALMIARRVKDSGVLVACMLLDKDYASNSHAKLGIDLGFMPPGVTEPTVTSTHFPARALAAWRGDGSVLSMDGEAWALVRFEPEPLKDLNGHFSVIAALNMTRERNVMRRNLAFTFGALAFASVLAILFGLRMARVMSRALTRLTNALKKLEQSEYVHVTGVKTGDEIEDLASGFNSMVDGLQERDKLRSTFGKYMTEQVMDHLLKGKVELGGEALTVTILFTDIRSFTTLSESMPAQELVALLNEYFTEMVTIVIQEGGVVDKYIGDAIMAVFGAPVVKEDDARRAVRAAIRMRDALGKLNERLSERGKPTLRTGIGIHTGEVIAGNIGSEARMEYTVIGDAVNLASRLESSTKDFGVGILISQDTEQLLEPSVERRKIHEITVKGRHQPVMVYEVVTAG